VILTLALIVLLPRPIHSASNSTFTLSESYEIEEEEEGEDVLDRRRRPFWKPGKNSFTKSEKGCPCWFDLTKTKECACCKPRAIQCGFPQHNKCKADDRNIRQRSGCVGVAENRFTLSESGYPCPWNPNDRSCAWCSNGAKMCINRNWAGGRQRRAGCVENKSSNFCLSVPQDCRLNPEHCDPNADCIDTNHMEQMMGNHKYRVFRCACKPGFIGNGIQCINEATGVIAPRKDTVVDVKMKLTTDFFEGPKVPASAFPHGSTGNDLMDKIDEMLNHGMKVCNGGCDAKVVTCGGKK